MKLTLIYKHWTKIHFGTTINDVTFLVDKSLKQRGLNSDRPKLVLDRDRNRNFNAVIPRPRPNRNKLWIHTKTETETETIWIYKLIIQHCPTHSPLTTCSKWKLKCRQMTLILNISLDIAEKLKHRSNYYFIISWAR